MKCDEIQRAMLSGEAPRGLDAHLADCVECRVFSDSLERFLKAKPDRADYVPPERLDEIVRREAEKRLGYMSETASWTNTVADDAPLRFGWASWLAATACLALAVWLVFSSVFRRPDGVLATAGTSDSGERSGVIRWRSVDMDEDFAELQIQIELDMAAIHASQCGEDDSGADTFQEPSQEDFALPPIWS